MLYRLFSPLVLLVALTPIADAAPPTYWQDVRPIMRKHCTVCHSEKNIKEVDVSAGLALDTLEAIKKGGPAPVLGKKSDESLLITILRHPKPARRMPLDAPPLPDATVEILKNWIDAGLPEGTKPTETDTNTGPITPKKRRDIVIATKNPLPKLVAKPGQTTPIEAVLPFGPLSPVAGVAFSPDASMLVVGSYGKVAVWNLKEGKLVKVLTNVLGGVNDLKFSPKGNLLAVGGGQPSARGEVRIFSVSEGEFKLQQTISDFTDSVSSISFHPDGELLAIGSFDKTVRLYNLKEKKSVWTFNGHSDFVHAVAFSPKGDWIATASKDRTGRLIDTKEGKAKLTVSGTEQDVLAVTISGDGSKVVTSGLEPALYWWDSATGERLKRTAGHDVGVHELITSPDGTMMGSCGGDGTFRLWNPKLMDSVRTVQIRSPVFCGAFSKEGKRVAVGCSDGVTRVIETETGRVLVTLVAISAEEWFAVTPEGYFSQGKETEKVVRWRSTSAIDGAWYAKFALDGKKVAQAFAGEKISEPPFAGSQP